MIRFLDDRTIAKLAFELFASSTIGRYERMATTAGQEVIARLDPLGQSGCLGELLERADQEWREVRECVTRGLSEVRLALLMCILSRSSDPRISEFLVGVSMVDLPVTAWASALARRLYNQRAGNSVRGTVSPLPDGIVVRVPQSLVTNEIRPVRPGEDRATNVIRETPSVFSKAC